MDYCDNHPWDDEADPFEDAICLAKSEEGERLCEALEELQIFLHEDVRHTTFGTPEELAEAERIFDALVKEVHKRFYAYSAKLCYIEATHGHA